MGYLHNGKWVSGHFSEKELVTDGRFVRKPTTFRNWIRKDGSTPFTPEVGRYHLYISYACPWASRALLTRALRGLEEVISISVVDWLLDDNGWKFSERDDAIPDTLNNAQYLYEIYTASDPQYSGRVTVPVLWDKQTNRIVNNESREIMRMLNTEFAHLGDPKHQCCPDALVDDIDSMIDANYETINNGVYKCGFATTQEAYEEAAHALFQRLDELEELLSGQKYLCGNTMTEADICLFVTLVRFDDVYVRHFKCNLRRLVDYPNLWNYTKEIYQRPHVAETVNRTHIKKHYFCSHTSINPNGIVPIGPIVDFEETHDRDRFDGN